jgi:metal-responsive CopG/Arc/MetJ family transcriptional regulator
MLTKTKTSVSISTPLLKEMAKYDDNGNKSEFIEQAITYYLQTLRRQERIKHDVAILNAHAEQFNREALENLDFQDDPVELNQP